MIDFLSNLLAGTMATIVCLFFVGTNWLGAIFVRPFFRLLVRTQPEQNSLLSGERHLRVFTGTGRLLLSSYPYWRYILLSGEEIK